MPTFRYKAVSADGEIIQGQMEAVSDKEVISRLQSDGNVPISAEQSGQGSAGPLLDFLSGNRRVTQKDTGMLTQQLATLLGAGLPLDRGLQILEDLADSEPLLKLIKGIRDQVRSGSSLSDALESRHGVFPRMYINMVRGGEAGGTLESTLARLAAYMKSSKELRDSVVSALIYPALLVILAIGSLMVLLAYVVPQFTPIFEELGEGLPLITQVVLLVGRILQGYWWAVGLGIFAVFAYFRQQMANPDSRLRWDRRLLRSRITGPLVSKMEMARLARTIGTLLSNGVPLLTSLSIGKSVLSNTVMAEGVESATKEVKTGDSLAHALAATDVFPKLALQMISVGEETGRLDTMLNDVADAYDVEVKTTVDRLMALLVPILTLVLAVMIAMIIIAVMLPILQVTELV